MVEKNTDMSATPFNGQYHDRTTAGGVLIVTFIALQDLIQRLPTFLLAFLLLSATIGFDFLLGFKPFVVSLYGVIGCSA